MRSPGAWGTRAPARSGRPGPSPRDNASVDPEATTATAATAPATRTAVRRRRTPVTRRSKAEPVGRRHRDGVGDGGEGVAEFGRGHGWQLQLGQRCTQPLQGVVGLALDGADGDAELVGGRLLGEVLEVAEHERWRASAAAGSGSPPTARGGRRGRPGHPRDLASGSSSVAGSRPRVRHVPRHLAHHRLAHVGVGGALVADRRPTSRRCGPAPTGAGPPPRAGRPVRRYAVRTLRPTRRHELAEGQLGPGHDR